MKNWSEQVSETARGRYEDLIIENHYYSNQNGMLGGRKKSLTRNKCKSQEAHSERAFSLLLLLFLVFFLELTLVGFTLDTTGGAII